ncbi:MAG: hypothetical protein KAW52_00380 [candidate division Zixibacteria bacterium]|nr:hypothetical protein [candidate division Zixibacteria bacterium]
MNRQNKEFRLIQKGLYSRDRITPIDRGELNKIQNEKAREFLKKYPDAVVGRINWYTEKDKEFPLLKTRMPLCNFSFNFALPERNKLIELAIKNLNESEFEAKWAARQIERISGWIRSANGIQFFWL